jgi:hypothetical protein
MIDVTALTVTPLRHRSANHSEVGGVYIVMKDPVVVRGAVVVAALVVAMTGPAATQSPPARAAQPIEPIGAIIDAFRSHSVVALGEDHGNEQGHAFRLRLLRDPRFTETVNDIVVEFGNPRYQELMDRFVTGEQIGDQALRRVWQDTTQISGVWDRPIYEDFFRAVRAVNATLPRERQLRVVLGDLPVDWDAARRSPPKPGEKRLLGQPVRDDATAGAMDRDRHAADMIQREILARQRRALLIFGDMHVTRRPTSIVGRLETDAGVRVFNIRNATRRSYESLLALQPDASSWPVPSLAIVAGTVLTQREFGDVDAVLYLGPTSAMTISRLSRSLCEDASYIAMRRERMALSGLPLAQADDLLSLDCPAVLPK